MSKLVSLLIAAVFATSSSLVFAGDNSKSHDQHDDKHHAADSDSKHGDKHDADHHEKADDKAHDDNKDKKDKHADEGKHTGQHKH